MLFKSIQTHSRKGNLHSQSLHAAHRQPSDAHVLEEHRVDLERLNKHWVKIHCHPQNTAKNLTDVLFWEHIAHSLGLLIYTGANSHLPD